jgi:hypothetical protein
MMGHSSAEGDLDELDLEGPVLRQESGAVASPVMFGH